MVGHGFQSAIFGFTYGASAMSFVPVIKVPAYNFLFKLLLSRVGNRQITFSKAFHSR